jgi:hypothetical protein
LEAKRVILVVEILGFGAVWTFRSMPTFRRNMLSLSSGVEGISAPEDGDSMFLRNVGIDLQIHTASKPKTSTTT